MSSILKKLLILLVIACFASKESISSESIKSFFSNSTLNIESSSLEIIDSEKKAIFKGQVKISHDDTYLATDSLILLYSIDGTTALFPGKVIPAKGFSFFHTAPKSIPKTMLMVKLLTKMSTHCLLKLRI